MKHFSEPDCIEFALDTATSDKREAMQRHLNSGCDHCRAELDFWQRIREFAKGENSYQPSDASVRSVKALFSMYKPKRVTIAQMLFDSFLRPVAGVRGITPGLRQLVYRTDDVVVDLRMESALAKSHVSGQVLKRALEPFVSNAVVLLFNGNTLMAHTTTNTFGEFQLEFRPADNVRVQIGIPQSGGVELQFPTNCEPGYKQQQQQQQQQQQTTDPK